MTGTHGMKRSKRLNKRAAVFAAVLAVCLFATLLAAVAADAIVGKSYSDLVPPFTAWLPDNLAVSAVIMAVFSALLGVGFYLFMSRFDRISRALDRVEPLKPLRLGFHKRDAVVASVIIFVLWIPIIVIMFPTGLTADTFNQLYQFQTAAPTYYPTLDQLVDAEFIDHHPVFDTLLYGAFWQLGAWAGSQDAGVFALAVLQSVVLAAELGVLVCYLERIGVPYVLRLAALVFFAWFPFFAHYACTVLKDTTYLTVFLPWMLIWVEAARTRGRVLDDKRVLVAFMVLGGLGVLTRKLGVFLLVPCLVVLAVVLHKQRVKIAVAGAATVLAFGLVLPAVVNPIVGGVAPGGRQEALGPAIQHVTALVHENPGALSEEERAICDKVFDVDEAEDAFEAFRTDGAKSAFRTSATTGDILAFLKVWAVKGLKHPVTYLTSTFETSGMLYIPFSKITYYSGDDMTSRAANYKEVNPDFAVSVAQPANLVELNDHLEFDSIESKISDLPIISLFFTEGFYGGWVPLIAVLLTLFARRRGKGEPFYFTALFPLVLTVAFLLVSPVASPRYILPLLFTTPLMLGWAWFSLERFTPCDK